MLQEKGEDEAFGTGTLDKDASGLAVPVREGKVLQKDWKMTGSLEYMY